MKGYFCSIIDCSKNHDEKLENIDLRLIKVFLIADGDFSSHPTVISTNIIQGRRGIRRNLKGQSSIFGLAVRDPIGVFATGVTSNGSGGK